MAGMNPMRKTTCALVCAGAAATAMIHHVNPHAISLKAAKSESRLRRKDMVCRERSRNTSMGIDSSGHCVEAFKLDPAVAAMSRGSGRLIKELRKRQKESKRKGEDDNAWIMKNRRAVSDKEQEDRKISTEKTPLRLSVLKITPDGRCMFRALVQGMATNNVNDMLTGSEETAEADKLRMAVNEALCRSADRRKKYMNAVRGAKAEYGTLEKFCRLSREPRHWGGEVELLVLSSMLRQFIIVYRPLADGGAFKILAEYGKEFNTKKSKPVRLLYNLRDHYDLLV